MAGVVKSYISHMISLNFNISTSNFLEIVKAFKSFFSEKITINIIVLTKNSLLTASSISE